MGNCKRDHCAGTLRRDGSCSQEGCTLHRPSRRGQHWIATAARKFLQTPFKAKKPKNRHCQKAPVPTTPKTKKKPSPNTPTTTATSSARMSIDPVPTENTPSTPSVAGAITEPIIDIDILDHALVPEDNARMFRNCFRFRAINSPDDILAPMRVCHLGCAVAAHYEKMLQEIGEPRALAVFSNISGILQKVPSQATFSPLHLYVAACFYLGWELAGSWSQREPSVIASANNNDVKRCALELLSFLGDH